MYCIIVQYSIVYNFIISLQYIANFDFEFPFMPDDGLWFRPKCRDSTLIKRGKALPVYLKQATNK